MVVGSPTLLASEAVPAERLQKVLAAAGVASRRGSEALIASGRVTVDGRVAEIGDQVDPTTAEVAVDGRRIGKAARTLHLVLHKPIGVTSTVQDPHADRTVMDLVPPRLRASASRLYPVGRLDLDSEGLLLLTNDGPWADGVLHPRHGVEREYAIGVAGALTRAQRHAIEAGIALDEGIARLGHLRPATTTETRRLEALIRPAAGPLTWYRGTLRQGWKRQLRRMFAAVGMPIARLVRVRIGTLRIDDLPSGAVRELRPAEVRQLGAASRAQGARGEQARGEQASGQLTSGQETSGQQTSAAAAGRRLVVALDGPSSSGKSSVGAAAALALGYRFCDTGLLYRALTWLAMQRDVPLDDGPRIANLGSEVELAPDAEGRLDRVLVDGRDMTDAVHMSDVDLRVSEVSRLPEVRAVLLDRQRALAAAGGIIMAGRDIGSVVLPDADLKLYLDASAEERARRRSEQRGLAADAPEVAAILDELRRRDRLDSTRPIAPLRIADDAVVLRTDGNEFETTVAEVVRVIREAEAHLADMPKGRRPTVPGSVRGGAAGQRRTSATTSGR
jgi:23S rRNA pseudouridine2605 synthase